MDSDAAIDRHIALIRRHLSPLGLTVAVDRAASTASAYLEIAAGPDASDRARGRSPLRLRISDHPPSRRDAIALDARDPEAWIDAAIAAAHHFGQPLPKAVERARRFRDNP